MVPEWWSWNEGPPVAYTLSLCPHPAEWERRAPWDSFYRSTNSIHESSRFVTQSPQKSLATNVMTLDVRITMYIWRNIDIQYIGPSISIFSWRYSLCMSPSTFRLICPQISVQPCLKAASFSPTHKFRACWHMTFLIPWSFAFQQLQWWFLHWFLKLVDIYVYLRTFKEVWYLFNIFILSSVFSVFPNVIWDPLVNSEIRLMDNVMYSFLM